MNTQHGLYAQPGDSLRRRAAVYAAERLAGACSHAELVQNGEDLETLTSLGVPRSRLHVLGNGVDLDRFRPGRLAPERMVALRAEMGAGPDDVICGTVGRLVWEKGYRELFAAADILRRREPRAQFVVVGPSDPDRPDAVDARAVEAAQAAGVRFLGMRDDVEDLYQAIDVFVLPSHREGFPRSAMEAAATGLPLVLTDIRGCREVVVSDENGLLVPPRDPEALADAIATLAADAPRRRRLGGASLRRAAEHFDQRRVIERTLAVYEQLLTARGLRP